MKIILSPSKTMEPTTSSYLTDQKLLYPEQTTKLLNILRQMTKKKLGKALSIKGNLLEQTYEMYQTYDQQEPCHAFVSYNGLVFKQLEKEAYNGKEYDYISKHVVVLDALYGLLPAGTLIKPYRLDMKASLGLSLYKFWNINDELDDELIINLASNEYNKMVDKPVIDVLFYEHRNGTVKSLATYAKMGRGLLLDYMIKHNVTTIEQIKLFNESNYSFNKSLSDDTTIVFVR